MKHEDRDSPQPLQGRGLMVVDGNAARRAETISVVRQLQVNVVEKTLGSEAVAYLLGGNTPEVLVVHQDLPDMEGSELCHRIHSNAAWTNIYVVLLSEAKPPDAAPFWSRGADDELIGAWDGNALRASVRAGLRAQANWRIISRRERRRAIGWLATVVAHEINNPLAAALGGVYCMDQILEQEDLNTEDVNQLREVVADTRAACERIHGSCERLNRQSHLRSAPVRRVHIDELLLVFRQQLQELPRNGQVDDMTGSLPAAEFDATLLIDATSRVLRESATCCKGDIDIKVHIDRYRVAVLIDLDQAPDIDPEIILEPRLASNGDRPPCYEPGLSAAEVSFAGHGGQIFARPMGHRWRYGLTLPVANTQP